MFTDTHCHLTSPKFREDRDEVIRRAHEAGVSRMIVPAENLADAKRIVKLANENEGIWGIAGYYPGNTSEIDKLRQLLVSEVDVLVGIGEIGLDEYWLKKDKEKEKELFREQLELAVELGLPVVIHNREAEREIREVMEGMKKLPRGQLHCWSGSDEFLAYVLDHDYYVGFCANITYPKNEKLREQAARVPAERLLLETDSPYLPPQGKRGERNTPENVKMTAALLADLRGVPLQELAKQTAENAKKLFRI